MAEVFDCVICHHTYDETGRKPRMLFCGHTYCQQCLHNVVSGSSPACPSCRKEIVTPVDELPVNFAIIPPTRSGKTASKSEVNKELSCRAHQNELDYWCKQCQISICKRCLVEAHADHKFTLIEEIIADKKLLSDKRKQIVTELQLTKTLKKNLQRLESVACKIDEKKSDILIKKKSVQVKELILTEWVDVLEKISSEPSKKQSSVIKKILNHQTQALTEVNICDALDVIYNWVSQLKVSMRPAEMLDQPFETYMPDGQQWNIISPELAKKALRTMKETDHKTPKATVISTDDDPILCLPELLQYLAASSASMELQLMDRAERKYLDNRHWFPLMAGGVKSPNYNHCYRLKALTEDWIYLQTLNAVGTSFGQVMNDSSRNKVIALLDPATCTHDICVLAYGKIVKSATGSWPLPLEVHITCWITEHWVWVKCTLQALYSMAQPEMGECRVYLPCDKDRRGELPSKLFPVLAELGKFSTKHRLFVPTHSVPNGWEPCYRRAAERHKLALEFRN